MRISDWSSDVCSSDLDSDLQVQYGKRERRLTLLKGRADFQVHHDTDRPFVVLVGDASVTATGTQFQVRASGEAGIVTLLEGQVVVAARDGQRSSDPVTLRKGERVEIGSASGRERVGENVSCSVGAVS